MGPSLGKEGSVKAKNHMERKDGHQDLVDFIPRFLIRRIVSKKRRRMLIAGYDLDMSYITDRVLAMSFPAERIHAVYRNPLWQVKEVLDMRHRDVYKVYNLCPEQSYDPTHFHGRVELCPFDDNHVPSLSLMKYLCESIYAWLSQDPKNIAVIHCMAGKGRTGLMVCAYLVYTGMSADEALRHYATKRTTNNQGVSIPSQRRYVGYWSTILSFPRSNKPPIVNLPQSVSRELRRIRLYDSDNIDRVFFIVSKMQEVPGQLYQPSAEIARGCCRRMKPGYHRMASPMYYLSYIEDNTNEVEEEMERPHFVVQMDTESSAIDETKCLDYYFEEPLQAAGDLRVIFYEKMIGHRLFYVCFNTSFIKSSVLQFSQQELDKVSIRGKSICGSSFSLELLFGPVNSASPSCQ